MAYATHTMMESPKVDTAPKGLTLQVERLERLLTVQDEMLRTLDQRLSFVMRPMNIPVNPVGSGTQPAPGSAAAEHLRMLLSQLESHNEKLIAMIECVDL